MIQLGDVLDRGREEIAILSLLRSLDIQAKAQGGAVFQVCNTKDGKSSGSEATSASCQLLHKYFTALYERLIEVPIRLLPTMSSM